MAVIEAEIWNMEQDLEEVGVCCDLDLLKFFISMPLALKLFGAPYSPSSISAPIEL